MKPQNTIILAEVFLFNPQKIFLCVHAYMYDTISVTFIVLVKYCNIKVTGFILLCYNSTENDTATFTFTCLHVQHAYNMYMNNVHVY